MNILLIIAAVGALVYFRNKQSGGPCIGCDSQPNVITTESQSDTTGNPANGASFWGAYEPGSLGALLGGGFSVTGGSGGAGGTAAVPASGGSASGSANGGSGTSSGSSSGSGGGPSYSCFTPDMMIQVSPGKFVPLSVFIAGEFECRLWNLSGCYEFKLIEHPAYDGDVIYMGCGSVTPNHPMTRGGDISANVFYPAEKFPRKPFKGTVWDISVVTSDPQAQHIVLQTGDIAHNKANTGGM
jgi:hypothetical protein